MENMLINSGDLIQNVNWSPLLSLISSYEFEVVWVNQKAT